MSKKWMVGIVGAAVLVVSANAVAFAGEGDTTIIETENYGEVLALADGRLNAFDVAAPVAVFDVITTLPDDEQGYIDTVTGLQLLAIDPETNNGVPVLTVDADQIARLLNGEVETISAEGFTLGYADGYFWVTAPADAEGKVYSFSWENTSFAA